jgi:hypothetical protein
VSEQKLSQEDGFPRVTSPPEPEDVVQVLMTERMARMFEARCLGPSIVGEMGLGEPLLFAEDDVPTYTITKVDP